MDTFTQELSKVDRAILDGETEGFVRVHVRKGTDEILGATVVAAHAGDLISELTLAMKGKLGLKTIGGDDSSVSHPSRGHPQNRRPLQSHPPDAFREKSHATLARLAAVTL